MKYIKKVATQLQEQGVVIDDDEASVDENNNTFSINIIKKLINALKSVATSSTNGLMSAEDKNKLDSLFFKSGDKVTVYDYCHGFITSGVSDIYITVPLNKNLKNVKDCNISVIVCNLIVRQDNNYIQPTISTSGTSFDPRDFSNLTCTGTIVTTTEEKTYLYGTNCVRLRIANSDYFYVNSSTTKATNNKPVSAYVNAIFTFT